MSDLEVQVAPWLGIKGPLAENERITAAAAVAHLPGGEKKILWVPIPGRHHHILHSKVLAEYRRLENAKVDSLRDCGFLTNAGRFLTRAQAEAVAVKTGQLTKPIIGGELTSEDLW